MKSKNMKTATIGICALLGMLYIKGCDDNGSVSCTASGTFASLLIPESTGSLDINIKLIDGEAVCNWQRTGRKGKCVPALDLNEWGKWANLCAEKAQDLINKQLGIGTYNKITSFKVRDISAGCAEEGSTKRRSCESELKDHGTTCGLPEKGAAKTTTVDVAALSTYTFYHSTQAGAPGSWKSPNSYMRIISIASAPDGTLWGINAANRVFMSKDNGITWTQPNLSVRLAHIAPTKNALWALDKDYLVRKSTDNGKTWETLEDYGSLQVDIDPENFPACHTNGSSTPSIAVAPDNTVWLTDNFGNTHIVPGQGVRLSDELLERYTYLIMGKEKYKKDIFTCLTQTAIASDGTLWGINAQGAVFGSSKKYPGRQWVRVDKAPLLKNITIAPDKTPWGITTDGKLVKGSFDGKSWVTVDPDFQRTHLVFGPDESLWAIGKA